MKTIFIILFVLPIFSFGTVVYAQTTTISSSSLALDQIPGDPTNPQGPADLEVTVDQVHVLRDQGKGLVTHTNHCVHPELTPINDSFPELIQSGPRKQRIDHLLQSAGGPLGLETLKQALRDHQDYPRSICRHANDTPPMGSGSASSR